jgi:hypothetical protein
MKLKKLREETPKYEGRFWSYQKRKFVAYDEWIKETNCCGSQSKDNEKENVKSK